jgi:hypothetical protein
MLYGYKIEKAFVYAVCSEERACLLLVDNSHCLVSSHFYA